MYDDSGMALLRHSIDGTKPFDVLNNTRKAPAHILSGNFAPVSRFEPHVNAR